MGENGQFNIFEFGNMLEGFKNKFFELYKDFGEIYKSKDPDKELTDAKNDIALYDEEIKSEEEKASSGERVNRVRILQIQRVYKPKILEKIGVESVDELNEKIDNHKRDYENKMTDWRKRHIDALNELYTFVDQSIPGIKAYTDAINNSAESLVGKENVSEAIMDSFDGLDKIIVPLSNLRDRLKNQENSLTASVEKELDERNRKKDRGNITPENYKSSYMEDINEILLAVEEMKPIVGAYNITEEIVEAALGLYISSREVGMVKDLLTQLLEEEQTVQEN